LAKKCNNFRAKFRKKVGSLGRHSSGPKRPTDKRKTVLERYGRGQDRTGKIKHRESREKKIFRGEKATNDDKPRTVKVRETKI
jgi:hypothetical protein